VESQNIEYKQSWHEIWNYRSGAIESWGRGTLNMLDIAKESSYPEPVYKEFMSGLTVCFPRKVFEDFPKDFTKEILSLIKQNPNITTVELANQLNVTSRTIANYLKN
jgi:predicted HTH transcriptional regulator